MDTKVYMGEQVVDELLKKSEDKIGMVILNYMMENLCPNAN